MCGIFGWVAYDHTTEPNPRLMQLAAHEAGRRGPHAHGWAIPGQATHRAPGPLDPAAVPLASALLGHARLATFGALTGLAAVQPIDVDGHRLVHNGNAPGAYDECPDAPSDTAALAIIYAAHRISGHPPSDALTYTATRTETPRALAVLDSDGSVWVSRHGQPLHILRTRTGVYLSSGELPGSHLVPEHYTLQLARPDVDDPRRINEDMFRAPDRRQASTSNLAPPRSSSSTSSGSRPWTPPRAWGQRGVGWCRVTP